MLREIRDQPRLAVEELGRLRDEASAAARALGDPPARLILTGCGDSWIASLALEPAARALLGRSRPVHALQALEAARYFSLGAGDLLVACSVSGEVARTLDAAEAAQRAGGKVVAVVARPASTLAALSDAVIRLPEPIARNTPHSRDYLATLLALGALLEALSGERVGALDTIGPALRDAMPTWEERARAIGPGLAAAPRIFLLGAGPSWPSALYGAAKLWEAGGVLALGQELEEFAHGQHLVANWGDGVILIAPSGPSSGRAAQMLSGFQRLGLRVVALAEADDAASFQGAEIVVLPAIPEPWSPLVSAVPLQLLAYEVANTRGLDVTCPLGGRPAGDVFQEVHAGWTRGGREPNSSQPEPA